MSYKLLKKAAAELEALADQLEASEKKLASSQSELAKSTQTKTAADKSADDTKTKRLALAKVAADKLLQAGLLSSPEKRDQFAAEIVDPEVAIQKIAKLAEHTSVPKMGSVVVDGHSKIASSEDVWASHVAATLSRLNLK